MELTEYLRKTWSLEGVGPITRGQRERIHEAAAEIERLRAELEARDSEIASWLNNYDPFYADLIASGSYRKDEA